MLSVSERGSPADNQKSGFFVPLSGQPQDKSAQNVCGGTGESAWKFLPKAG
jgi:hypothetical protein